MLAQNFKTAAELGITEVERDALIKVLGHLERGDLPGTLDLGLWCCGTTACIAGWAWEFSYREAFVDVVGLDGWGSPSKDWLTTRHNGLHALFLSHRGNEGAADIALRNYLTHGEPRWSEALEAPVSDHQNAGVPNASGQRTE